MRVRVSVSAVAQRSRAAAPASVSSYVRLAGTGHGFVPLAGDEALLLERAQDAVEVADVHALLADHGREPLEEVVAVAGALIQQEQDRRDLKALDPTASTSSDALHVRVDTYV